ncbi:MAG: zinc-binding dehydrogenase [Thermostichales cyanobacterium SZTDM-1c_bins_54]
MVMPHPGSPLVWQQVPDPPLERPDQIRVRLQAAAVNPVDTKLRQRGVLINPDQPAILGCDGAGIVTEVGSQVRRFQVGDPVFFCYGGIGLAAGTYAEQVVIPEWVAARKPEALSFVQAAALPLVLITAWESLLERGRLQAGQQVFVAAGAGGVGHIAIQIATIHAAHVITTVSTPAKAELVQSLGCDRVLNYRQQDWQQQILAWTQGQGVDLGFDTVGGSHLQQVAEVVRPYGDVVTILQPDGINWQALRPRNLRLSVVWMLAPMRYGWQSELVRQRQILEHNLEHLVSGKLRVHISHTLPLVEANTAHHLIEQGGMTGKIVLTM